MKTPRKRPPDEKKQAMNMKMGEMERHKPDEKLLAYFHRKPYDLGNKND